MIVKIFLVSCLVDIKVEILFQWFCVEFFESCIVVIVFVILMVIVFLVVFVLWIMLQNLYDFVQVDVFDGCLLFGLEVFVGYMMWLGLDGVGRDFYLVIFYGLCILILVGLVFGVIVLFIGMIVGLIVVYVGGCIEVVIMWIVDFQLLFLVLLVVLMLVVVFGKGVDKIILVLVVV